MARSSTTNYKHYAKSPRQITTESDYVLGMKYSDNALDDGFLKTLVNFDYLEQGTKMKPRGGFKQLSFLDLGTLPTNGVYQTLWSGDMYVKVGNDAVLTRAQIVGIRTGDEFLAQDVKLVLENPSTFAMTVSTASAAPPATLALRIPTVQYMEMHGESLTSPQTQCIAAVVDNTLFMAFKDGTAYGLMKLEVTYATGAYTHVFTKMEGKEITPYEAVNYGYNMLDDDPYVFSNIAGSMLKLQGILPYDNDNNLKLSAQVGELLTFKLIYQYPSAETKKYKVQWEFNDLTTDRAPYVVQSATNSPEYTPGAEIKLVKEPPYKAFSVTAKVYYSDDLNTVKEVILLSAYYITKDKSETGTKNFKPVNYAVNKPDGMCAWASRAVVWGIEGARNMVFVSDTNAPSYFPFPQMSFPCTDNVQFCIPYMNDLLIFTDTRLLRATLMDSAITTSIIQENLCFRGWDSRTVLTVKNMVYFKTNNYFYMVVPVLNAKLVYELKLAPVSTPIEPLLDDFVPALKTILSEMYDIEFPLMSPQGDWTFSIKHFQNWLDNTTVYNSYLCHLTSAAESKDVWLEVSLKYDTMLRNWCMDVVETNDHPRTVYRRIVTSSAIYTNLYVSDGHVQLQTLQADPREARDTNALGGTKVRHCPNYQYFDSGKRAHDVIHKKRFRQIQFRLNNVSKEDLYFRDSFIIDDDPRTDIYEYRVEHITDKLDPDYGKIYIDRVPTDLIPVPGATKLGSWTLGVSQLPEVSIIPVFIEVSGKGYNGRYKLLSTNSAMYELLSISWVYRMMNAR